MIGIIVDGQPFLSLENMTPSTSKHLNYARSAANNAFMTPAFTWHRTSYAYGSWTEYSTPTPAQLIIPAAEEMEERFKSLLRKRANLEYFTGCYEERRAEILRLAERFGVTIPAMPEVTGDLQEKAKELRIKEQEARKERERQERERREMQQQRDQEAFSAWMEHGRGQFPWSFRSTTTDFITVKNGYLQETLSRANGNVNTPRWVLDYGAATVITSRGAEAPLDHVRKAISFYQSRRKDGTCGPFKGKLAVWEPYRTNGHKIHLGHFTLDEIDEQGNVRAGCHRFTAAEIARFIEQWKEVL